MKEWDLDAYSRKYQNTLTVFKDKDKLICGYVKGITMNPEQAKKKELSVVFMVKHNDKEFLTDAEPIYYRFKGGLYQSTKGDIIGVSRRPMKSFKVGLNDEGFKIVNLKTGLPARSLYVDPFTPVPVDIGKALKDSGAISDLIYINKSKVYFATQEVGLRKGSKFMVNGSVWQEVKDCLQGWQCSISM